MSAKKSFHRRLLLAFPPCSSVLLLRSKHHQAARALDEGACGLVPREGAQGRYTFQVPGDWSRQKVRGVEQLWSSPSGDALGSNLNITSIVVARGTERESAMRILENVKSKGGGSGEEGEPKRIAFDGGEVLVLEILEPGDGSAASATETSSGAWSLSPGPGLRIKTDDAAVAKQKKSSKFILSVAIPEGSGRIYLQTIQILSGSLEVACAEKMAQLFMQ